MAEESFINDIFSELDSEELQKNIKAFIVKPIISMIYNDLFPYICFFASILLVCIFLLLFVVFILAFSH